MSFDDLLKGLQADYLSSLPEKIKTIDAQVQARQAADVRESFHKLKGTGKTYGFPEVSELAEIVENICIRNLETGLAAATLALPVLADIHAQRRQNASFSLNGNERVERLRKLLPS